MFYHERNNNRDTERDLFFINDLSQKFFIKFFLMFEFNLCDVFDPRQSLVKHLCQVMGKNILFFLKILRFLTFIIFPSGLKNEIFKNFQFKTLLDKYDFWFYFNFTSLICYLRIPSSFLPGALVS